MSCLINYIQTHYRVVRMAGEDGTLTKENFTKILRSSDLFMKTFDKNKDGIVTEVCIVTDTARKSSSYFLFSFLLILNGEFFIFTCLLNRSRKLFSFISGISFILGGTFIIVCLVNVFIIY